MTDAKDRVPQELLLRLRLQQQRVELINETKRSLALERRAIAAESALAAAELERAQQDAAATEGTLKRAYGLKDGDGIADDGTILREPGGAPEPPPAPPAAKPPATETKDNSGAAPEPAATPEDGPADATAN